MAARSAEGPRAHAAGTLQHRGTCLDTCWMNVDSCMLRLVTDACTPVVRWPICQSMQFPFPKDGRAWTLRASSCWDPANEALHMGTPHARPMALSHTQRHRFDACPCCWYACMQCKLDASITDMTRASDKLQERLHLANSKVRRAHGPGLEEARVASTASTLQFVAYSVTCGTTRGAVWPGCAPHRLCALCMHTGQRCAGGDCSPAVRAARFQGRE